MATRSTDRTNAWGAQLAQVHDTLRTQLRDVRGGLRDPGDLLTHCLAFCTALTTHHLGEDEGLFTELVRARPDLARVVDNLVQDHRMISSIVTTIRGLATEASTATDARRQSIRRELDGLAAIVESHFRYEERAIGAALDGLHDTGWTGPVLHP